MSAVKWNAIPLDIVAIAGVEVLVYPLYPVLVCEFVVYYRCSFMSSVSSHDALAG